MAAHNRLEIIGHLGGDPELRYTSNGTEVCNFSVAVNNPYDEDAGPTWFKVTMWGKRAEVANQYLAKGRPVFLAGRVELDEWENNQGEVIASLKLTANEMVFLGSGGSEEKDDDDDYIDDDDLPF